MDVEAIKKMNENKKLVKKYHAFLASPWSRNQQADLFCIMLVILSQLVDLFFDFSWL
jgi:hypothetical protein